MTAGVQVLDPRVGVVSGLAGTEWRCGTRTARGHVERSKKRRRHQRLVGGAAKVAAFHQSVYAPHSPTLTALQPGPHTKNRATIRPPIGTYCGSDLPSTASSSEIAVGRVADVPGRIALPRVTAPVVARKLVLRVGHDGSCATRCRRSLDAIARTRRMAMRDTADCDSQGARRRAVR